MRGRKFSPGRDDIAAAALATARRMVSEAVKLARSTGMIWSEIEHELRLKQFNGNNAWRLAGNKNKPVKKRKSA